MPLLDLAELEWLDQQSPLRLQWSSELHAAACKAATEGNIALLRTILARSGFHCRSQASNRHYCQDATCSASSSCALLCLILSFCTQKLKVYRAAVTACQVPVLAWLFHEVHPCPWEALHAHCDLVSRLLCAAAASGQLPVLLWLHEELPSQLWKHLVLTTFKAAAQADRLPVLEWLRDHSDHQDWTADFSAAAAKVAGLRILNWLCLRCSPPCPVDATTMASAAAAGKLGMLKLLRSLSPPCPMDDRATDSAMSRNQPACLTWLRNEQQCPWQAHWLLSAVHSSSLEAVKTALALDPPLPSCTRLCCAAMTANNAESLAWLLENGAPHPDRDQVTDALGPWVETDVEDAIFLILSFHHVPMPPEAIEKLQFIQGRWYFLMQLVQRARSTQKLLARQGPSQLGTPWAPPQGLLMQLAQLPNELILRIGAAAGMYYRQGSRVLPHGVNGHYSRHHGSSDVNELVDF